jgi:hypothetical protein
MLANTDQVTTYYVGATKDYDFRSREGPGEDQEVPAPRASCSRTIGKSRSQLDDKNDSGGGVSRIRARVGIDKLDVLNRLRCHVPDPPHAIPLRVKKWVAAKVFLYRICPPTR